MKLISSKIVLGDIFYKIPSKNGVIVKRRVTVGLRLGPCVLDTWKGALEAEFRKYHFPTSRNFEIFLLKLRHFQGMYIPCNAFLNLKNTKEYTLKLMEFRSNADISNLTQFSNFGWSLLW